MALGNLDALGIGRFDETTPIGTEFSDYMNLGLDSVSGVLANLIETTYAQKQLDTTNSTGRFIVQHGIGKITGPGSSPTASEAVTFPVAFASTPVIVVSGLGFRATGAFNPTSLSASQSVVGSPQGVTTTGFNANLYQATGSNLSAAQDWYYNWIAIGVAA